MAKRRKSAVQPLGTRTGVAALGGTTLYRGRSGALGLPGVKRAMRAGQDTTRKVARSKVRITGQRAGQAQFDRGRNTRVASMGATGRLSNTQKFFMRAGGGGGGGGYGMTRRGAVGLRQG
jgi:hypothetical protein